MNVTILRCLAVPFCAASLLAQTTLTVGPGGYAEIGAALLVAQNGDTIVVQPGTYQPFTVNVGVRIVAPGGATVSWFTPSGPSQSTVFQAPPGQCVYVNGIVFGQAGSLYPHLVRAIGCHVAFEHCTFPPTHPFNSYYSLLTSAADVVLTSCTFSSFNGAVSISGGSFTASDCAFHGVDPQGTFAVMPAALDVNGARVDLSFCTVAGGSSATVGQPGCPGMRVNGSSDVSLVSCLVTGGDRQQGSGTASEGLINNGALPVRHLRSSFVGGNSRIFTNWGSWPIRGPGIVGSEQTATLLGAAPLPYGLRVGQSYGFASLSAPNTPVLFAVGFGLAGPTLIPQVAQPIQLDLATAQLLDIGVATGGPDEHVVTYSLPAVALGTPIWVQGVAFDGSLFQPSVPIGGLVH